MDTLVQKTIEFTTFFFSLKIVEYIFPLLQNYIKTRRESKTEYSKHLTPLLHACGELYGKLESLAKEDFSTYVSENNSNSNDIPHNKLYISYLFCQVFAHMELLRQKNMQYNFKTIKNGEKILRFIETTESRKFRILDRSKQRILGEYLINKNESSIHEIMTLQQFEELIENNPFFKKYYSELTIELSDTKNKNKRQRILIFGIIIAIIIDYYDPDYKIVRRRKIYTNKLTETSKRTVRNYLLNHYLPFINKRKESYYMD